MNSVFLTFLILAFVSLPHLSQTKKNPKKLDKKLCDCPTYEPKIKGRIVNGKEVSKKDFRYIASMFVKYEGEIFEHVCTGIIINPSFVLSAANCVNRKFLTNNSAFAGAGLSHDLADIYTSEDNFRAISKIHIHPELKDLKTKIKDEGEDYYTTHDLTLYGVDKPFVLGASTNIYPACVLNFAKHDFEGDLYVASWGMRNPVVQTIRNRRMTSENEQEINIQLDIGGTRSPMNETKLSMAELRQADESDYESFSFNTDQFIIAKSEISSVCRGDKGSPLASNLNNKNIVIGLVTMMDSRNDSKHIYHCFPGSLSFSTPIHNYLDWIHTIVGSNLC